MLKASKRGQSLFEAVCALALLTGAAGIVAAAVTHVFDGQRSALARYCALQVAANAANDVIAATEYDPAALAAVGNATWTQGGYTLQAVVTPSGSSRRRLVIRFDDGAGLHGDFPLDLIQLSPPPDAIIDARPR